MEENTKIQDGDDKTFLYEMEENTKIQDSDDKTFLSIFILKFNK